MFRTFFMLNHTEWIHTSNAITPPIFISRRKKKLRSQRNTLLDHRRRTSPVGQSRGWLYLRALVSLGHLGALACSTTSQPQPTTVATATKHNGHNYT